MEHVKSLICEKEGIPPDQQRISSVGKLLRDGRRLKDCNVLNESTLDLSLSLLGGMQIVVRMPDELVKGPEDETITLTVSSSLTIGNVKTLVQEEKGIPVDQQRLIYFVDRTDSEQLEDEKTLSDYDIKNEATIILVLKASKSMQIHARSLNLGRVFHVEVKASDTIQGVKAKFEEMTGAPQNLSFQRKHLKSWKKVGDYAICDGSWLNMVHSGFSGNQIYFKTETGRTFSAQLLGFHTFNNVKAIIQDNEGIPQDTQELVFEGKPLEDKDYVKLPDKSTVLLTIKRIEIFLKGPADETITLTVATSDSVENVKCKIQVMKGVPPEQQRLLFAEAEMRDGRVLSDYNVQNESTVQLLVRPKGGMQIFVKTLASKVIPLEVINSDTIEEVKAKFYAEDGIRPDMQQLTLSGKLLENEKTLEDYDIRAGCTLCLGIFMSIFKVYDGGTVDMIVKYEELDYGSHQLTNQIASYAVSNFVRYLLRGI